jgi:hypothetical protein
MNAKPAHSARWTMLLVLAVLLLAPVLYVLSVGPASWLCHKGVISQEAAATLDATIYAPIDWACHQSPAVDRAVSKYLMLWHP